MGFARQEYWSRLPFPSLGDLLSLGIKPASPTLAGRLRTTEPLGKPSNEKYHYIYTHTHTHIQTIATHSNIHRKGQKSHHKIVRIHFAVLILGSF